MQKASTLSTRSDICLYGPHRERSYCCRSPLKEGAIGFTIFDDPMNSTGHLGGDCGIRLAAQIGVVTVFGDIAFEFVPKAIRVLEGGDLPGHPEGAAQARVAVF